MIETQEDKKKLERLAKYAGVEIETLINWKIQAEKNDVDAPNGLHNLYYAVKLMYYFDKGSDGEEQNINKVLRNINHVKSNLNVDNNFDEIEKHIKVIHDIKVIELKDLFSIQDKNGY